MSYSSAPVQLTDGIGSVVAFRDITERQERELRIRRELEAMSWVGRIREALRESRFVLYAQPITDLLSGETVKHEMLVRMIGTNGEVIMPGEFLPVAEQHGLIGGIDRCVLDLALPYAAHGHHIAQQAQLDSDLHTGDAGEAPDMMRRQAQGTRAQERQAASQDVLDDAQRSRDEHQLLLDDQQSDIDDPNPTKSDSPQTAERKRAEQMLARADAMEERAEAAAQRAASARHRAQAALERA